MRRKRMRFAGAGGSSERLFRDQRKANVREDWRVWLALVLTTVGFAIWSLLASGLASRFLAAAAGLLVGVGIVVWALGGHVSTFRWWLGAEGERATAREVEQLGPDWHCEHDIEHDHGNWDHVLVGPPGVFLLDSKFLHGTAAAAQDALRCGRMRFSGSAFRSGAWAVKSAVQRRLGTRSPWVQAVAVVWGDFPQQRHTEDRVVYLSGEHLTEWLESLDERLNAPQRAAIVEALKETRIEIKPGAR
jgi:Nuclease-related domain